MCAALFRLLRVRHTWSNSQPALFVSALAALLPRVRAAKATDAFTSLLGSMCALLLTSCMMAQSPLCACHALPSVPFPCPQAKRMIDDIIAGGDPFNPGGEPTTQPWLHSPLHACVNADVNVLGGRQRFVGLDGGSKCGTRCLLQSSPHAPAFSYICSPTCALPQAVWVALAVHRAALVPPAALVLQAATVLLSLVHLLAMAHPLAAAVASRLTVAASLRMAVVHRPATVHLRATARPVAMALILTRRQQAATVVREDTVSAGSAAECCYPFCVSLHLQPGCTVS